MVETLGRAQASRASANDEDVNVTLKQMSENLAPGS
jgi:hypothetical protein